MIIICFPPSIKDTVFHELPEPDMVVDPRDIFDEIYKFKMVVYGTTLKVIRIDRKKDERPGCPFALHFRVYRRDEFHYSFESMKYLYHGIDDECAPLGATKVIVKDGIETINDKALCDCTFLTKVVIPNTVTSIENTALADCGSLRFIQLPSNLQIIGRDTF